MTTTETSTVTDQPTISGERADLLETLAKHRYFLRYTVRDLTDEQAAQTPTASELCLGGLIKHVAGHRAQWADFIVERRRRRWSRRTDGDWHRVRRRVPDAARRDAGRRAGRLRAGRRADRRARRAPCPTWTSPTRCPRRRGSSPARAGRPAGCCCTSSPRPPSTPATPTSSASRSTARRRWADPAPRHKYRANGTFGQRHWPKVPFARLRLPSIPYPHTQTHATVDIGHLACQSSHRRCSFEHQRCPLPGPALVVRPRGAPWPSPIRFRRHPRRHPRRHHRSHRSAEGVGRPGRRADAVDRPDLTDARRLLHDRLHHRAGRNGGAADLPRGVRRVPGARRPDARPGPAPALGRRLLHLRLRRASARGWAS